MLALALVLAGTPAALAAPEVLRAAPTGAPTFTVGIAGTQLRLAQHADGSVVMMASDGQRSVSCAGYGPTPWKLYRDYFAGLLAWWPTAPNLRFGPADPAAATHAAEGGVCDVSAYTADYHLYVEIARLEGKRRTDLVRVELSPIQTTHDVVDASAVQRVEDNTFGVRLAQVAGAALAKDAYDAGKTVTALQAGIEDTRTYNVQVIQAHTDLSLFVLVLDAYLLGGGLADNGDVEAAYRIDKLLGGDDARSYFTVLAHLARGESSAEVLGRVRACGEGADLATCLADMKP